MLHDWFGLAPATRAFCDALCGAGFTALAPDLYDGRRASTVDEARALKASSDEALMKRRALDGAGHLRDNWHPRLGIVGFSMGASLAMEIAPEVAEALVAYYGAGSVEDHPWRIPLLGHFAERDEFEPLDQVSRLFERLSRDGDDVEFRVYEGTGHWFASGDVPDAFDPGASAEAWAATVDFLQYHLA